MERKTVIVVGAGLSGICMGIALKELEVDFLILEKSSELGGTWSQNRYPGCGCDIPMFAYCYSFELFEGDAWAKQPEILEYFRRCVKKYNIHDHILYRSVVKEAVFDEAQQHWNLLLEDSRQYCTRFLVNATGQLNKPYIPDIKGVEDFQKTFFHSANYPANFSHEGKVVGILGNGATALQLVESLQPEVKELFVFARSPKYVFPRVRYSPVTISKIKSDLSYWQQVRQQFIDSQDKYRLLLDNYPQFDPFDKSSTVREFYAQSNTVDFDEYENFYQWMSDHEMRPGYPTGCSRPLVSNTFHEAIRASNVKLISDPIQGFGKASIEAGNKKYVLDFLIFATGFSLNNLVPPYVIKGSASIPLSEAWKNSPETYLGMVTSGYPNLFFLYGPNTNTNASSVTFFVECQVNYIRQVIQECLSHSFASVEIKSEILQRYTRWISSKNQEVSEASSCASWYKNINNINISTFPGGFREYEKLTANFVSSEYNLGFPSQSEATLKDHDVSAVDAKLIDLFSQTTLLSSAEIELGAPLRDHPLDSILIVDFIKRINQYWGLSLEPAVFFEHASLQELSLYLKSILHKSTSHDGGDRDVIPEKMEVGKGKNCIPVISKEQIDLWKNKRLLKEPRSFENPHEKEQVVSKHFVTEEPIAIIGAHGYFPRSYGLDAFWRNLVQGKDCITEIPQERWDWQTYYGNSKEGDKTKVKWGGFIDGVDQFDPLFFKISPKEAELMDPQHRLFLQCAWELIESAGYNPAALSGKRIGVILGVNLNDYAELVAENSSSYDVLQMSGLMHLFGANRLSYLFGFTGPSEVVDTACSSSLIAIHRAMQSIRADHCEMMLAGGSNLILTPKMHLLYSKAGMLSEDGRCKTFSNNANGYVRGEGVAAVLLKRLSSAEKDGDLILGVIRGSAENHGGKANSLTAPNPKLQAKLIEEAMLASKVDPRTVGYIECHGTGTALGDPIEINGIRKAYENLYRHYNLQSPEHSYCGLGSVKSNIGHLETAAGIAGVIKVLLCFKHQYLPKTLHASPVNSQIHLDKSPFYLLEENKPWDAICIDGEIQPRRACVSSFGAGGSNAHLVLEEYCHPSNSSNETVSEPVIIPLSAGSTDQLRQKILDLLNFIHKEGQSIDLTRMAYTLQVGREAMEERLGLIVGSVGELAGKLQQYIDGVELIEEVYVGQVNRHKDTLSLFSADSDLQETINKWIARRKLSRLLDLWVKGLELDWNKFYGKVKPRRTALPTYPFAKARYWIDTAAGRPSAITESGNALLHPLLHVNISDFNQQCYKSTFRGDEFFLNDHQVRGQKILPAVAYLEMARASVEQALTRESGMAVLTLRNIVWAQPVIVTEPKDVMIALFAGESDDIDYEIYSDDREQGVVHCQGQVIFSDKPVTVKLDIGKLKARMQQGRFESAGLYSAFSRMGFDYGVSHQGVTAIYQGEHELLAQLRLPELIRHTKDDYLLHPSLMDSALQACMGLIADLQHPPLQPLLPFAMDSLHVVSTCIPDMLAWVRYSMGSRPGDVLVKLDIDLCDQEGNVCVQIQGFSSRALRTDIGVEKAGDLVASPKWESSPITSDTCPFEYAQHRVILCELTQIDVRKVEMSIPGIHCLLLKPNKKNIAERYSDIALACFEELQTVLKGKFIDKVILQIVMANDVEHAVFAGLSGMLKTAALENPRITGQIILAAPKITSEDLVEQLLIDRNRPQESIIKYEQGKRHILRWREAQVMKERPRTLFKDHGVYLITGGLGGLGILFAKEILRNTTHARIIFTGRSGLTAEKQSVMTGLRAREDLLAYWQMDVGNLGQVSECIAAIINEHRQLNGIIHCAGMIADNFLLKKTPEEFQRVLMPKVTGTFNLDLASKEIDLDFLVFFSSVVSATGNIGQADYAAANGFMDQFAVFRNRLVDSKERKGKTLSINWPLWQEGGIRVEHANQEMLRQSTGLQPLGTQAGMLAFYQSLALSDDQILVMEGDLPKLWQTLSSSQVAYVESVSDEQAEVPEVNVSVETIDIDSGGLIDKTQDYLRKEFAGLLKLPLHQIDPQSPLEKYGIDSILAMNLTNQLEKTFGSLPKTLFFEYQTICELGEYFVKSYTDTLVALFYTDDPGDNKLRLTNASVHVSPQIQTKHAVARRFNRRPTGVSAHQKTASLFAMAEPIAIIGLSGRYPEASNIDEYWRNLRDGKDCIIEIPRERWDWRDYFTDDRNQSGHHFSKWGGFIGGVDEFDPRFFNISPREAVLIDPQERLFLQHAWMAVEDAGYTRDRLQIAEENDLAGQVGVYAGVMYGEYQLFGAEASAQGQRMGFASSVASIANRVSYVFNLHGPSMTLDTMCSSSLTAIHLACQDLKLGRTSLAIAGGVNVSIHPNKYLMLSAGQFISSDGHCQSFGEGGDGYIPGEGVGVVVLKRLSEAEKDGHRIYGVIKASVLNHGGKTNGYTVPNPQAQASAIYRALVESNINPRHISYIEAHGTGTKLGDPIEIAALSKAFQRYTQDTCFCLIGSAKSNIGHCESAAGIAGLTKVLLQMQHQQIVPSLHSEMLNPNIDFEKTPFVVNQTLRDWPRPVIAGSTIPRIAGISSFGAGGSNAHVIVEEYEPAAEVEHSVMPVGRNGKVIIPLSARTEEQLNQKVNDLLIFLNGRTQESVLSRKTVDLFAMAYTLQIGREAMAVRLAFVVNSIDELIRRLKAYVNGEQDIEDVYQGQVKSNKGSMNVINQDDDMKEAVEKWVTGKKLSKLGDLWVNGLELDWEKLYGDDKPGFISLPTYPFAKERYWVDTSGGVQIAASGKVTAALHPLLHANTSDLFQQSYISRFDGDEFFVMDYRVNGQKALPVIVCLEMARAAVEKAVSSRQGGGALELQDMVFSQPIVVAENKQISIALFAKEDEAIGYEIYSGEGEEEIIHCQGYAAFSYKPAPARLDLGLLKGKMGRSKVDVTLLYNMASNSGLHYGPAYRGIKALYRGNGQLLAELSLPGEAREDWGDYMLHPSLVECALLATLGLTTDSDGASSHFMVPAALKSLCIVAAFSEEMFVWLRYSTDSQPEVGHIKIDIDFCDQAGGVCAQIHGLQLRQASPSLDLIGLKSGHMNFSATSSSAVLPFSHMERLLVFTVKSTLETTPQSAQRQHASAAVPKKPAGLSLANSLELASELSSSLRESGMQFSTKPTSIVLSNTGAAYSSQEHEGRVPESSLVSVYDNGGGVFSIHITASDDHNRLSPSLIEALLSALERVRQETMLKVLMISGGAGCFLRGGRAQVNAGIVQKLYSAITAFPYPVIAVMQGEASGAGFLFGALCDFMVCTQEGIYSYTDLQADLFPSAAEDRLLRERFGGASANDFLYQSTVLTGRQLREKGWTCPVLPSSQVEAYAQRLASTLATKPQDALRLLKQHLTRYIVRLVNGLAVVDPDPPTPDNQADTVKTDQKIISPANHIHLESHAGTVLVIRIGLAGQGYGLKDLRLDLEGVWLQVKKSDHYKSLILVSDYPNFLPVTAQEAVDEAVFDLQRLMLESPVPVVTALNGDAKGIAWYITQFSDACIYSEQGRYGMADTWQHPELARQAAMIFIHRFGDCFGKEILLTGMEHSGLELQQRIGALNTAEQDQVLPEALRLAESWAKLPLARLLAWKGEKASSIREVIDNLPAWLDVQEESVDSLPETASDSPIRITLESEVISATVHSGGILEVEMIDRQAKNMFSDALIEGMSEVFAHIEQTPAYKVIVLTGYDNYFASGGTRETLLAIQEGKVKFTDRKIFQFAVDCRIPVIAAMQGHGIGAGWALGMFADVIVFSEESKYVSPYMNYGFTPGAGATVIFPEKVGADLARETLLAAQEIAGSELRNRGLSIPVLSRVQVVPAAMNLAKKIAKHSRNSLIGIKHQWTQILHNRLEETYKLELAMHEKTFVGQAETLGQIQTHFHQEVEAEISSVPDPDDSVLAKSVPEEDTLPSVTATLQKLLAQELHMRAEEIEEDAQFIDLGLDSITGVTWVRKINEQYKTSIDAIKVYSYPTLIQLSRYVKQEAEKQGTLVNTVVAPAAKQDVATLPTAPNKVIPPNNNEIAPFSVKAITSRRKHPKARISSGVSEGPSGSVGKSQPIAVIGLAGQFPQAKNLEEYWDNISKGKNCITEVPKERWEINAFYHEGEAVAGKTNSKWMGALEEYDLFDPLFFTISPVEAENMDPQQRLFLQTCWHSIEHAGYNPKTLSGSKCGVFVGCTTGDYHQLSKAHQLSAQGFTGGATSILAARVSYFLDLQGPCLSIDTACSSSLVAIANACDSLMYGSCDLALSGGVYVMATPEMLIKTSQAGMLSQDGRCFTFDQRANGFVPGEGVGVVVLKRLADAEKDEDMIHGVIQGWGVNQDGKTNGITAPNAESQTRLQQDVYDKFRIDPANIQLIEAHGTGTKLGDPIEVDGIKASFQKYTRKTDYCALGSVKSNIGHCLTAAGVAGVLKLILALKHKQLPPTINFDQLNEHIKLNDTPFYINSRLQTWTLKDTVRRQAAISSFGFSGTNAHMVIAEYLPPSQTRPPATAITQDGKVIVPLSARTAEQLMRKARDLLDFIRKEGRALDLIEMAYTLQVGREAMEERLGFMVSSVEQLAEKLRAYVESGMDIDDVYQGQVKRNKDGLIIINQDEDIKEVIIDRWIEKKKLSKLLSIWVKGLELNWSRLYGEVKPRRISLPTYPFAKERYWIDGVQAGQQSIPNVGQLPVVAAMLHPLLHTNTSDLIQQSYSSTFSGHEFFLEDHKVKGEKVLPGVAYLEIARAAIERAMPIYHQSGILEMRNIVWTQPFVVAESKKIAISLLLNETGGFGEEAGGNEQIDFEICSGDKIEPPHEVIHCQGQIVFSRQPAPAPLNIVRLKEQMQKDVLESCDIYSIFEGIGLDYGPAHRGITSIYLGEKQLLAFLRIPAVVEEDRKNHWLHPSLMDSALQSSIGLIRDVNRQTRGPALPFALEDLRVISVLTKEMIAWVRYSGGNYADSKIVKFDIDLCDMQGNICVQMRGFSTRVLEGDIGSLRQKSVMDEIHTERDSLGNHDHFDHDFYQTIVDRVLNNEISVDEAVKLG